MITIRGQDVGDGRLKSAAVHPHELLEVMPKRGIDVCALLYFTGNCTVLLVCPSTTMYTPYVPFRNPGIEILAIHDQIQMIQKSNKLPRRERGVARGVGAMVVKAILFGFGHAVLGD